VVEITFLEPVEIRSVWTREDRDFTPWLANEEPLRHLLQRCGIEMGSEPSIRTEVKIPGLLRSLDILVELETGELIAIENQFAQADHDHLTRALAYAVGLEATTVIVVAESHRPEFVAVAQYLNAAGLAYEDHGIRVILVAFGVETSRGSSVVHPSFEVIAEPDEWKAAVALVSQEQFSERDTALFNFHERILPLLRESTDSFNRVNPSTNQWKSGAVGIGGLSVTYGVRQNSTYLQIWFSRVNARTANHAGLEVLRGHVREIERLFQGYVLDWRVNATSILEVIVDGIGYDTDPQIELMQEVASVAGRMADIIRQYRSEIVIAVSLAEASNQVELHSDDDVSADETTLL
jgi:hypothetical protein